MVQTVKYQNLRWYVFAELRLLPYSVAKHAAQNSCLPRLCLQKLSSIENLSFRDSSKFLPELIAFGISCHVDQKSLQKVVKHAAYIQGSLSVGLGVKRHLCFVTRVCDP